MPQRRQYPPYKGKQPQRFIPRRDLFPDEEYNLPNKPVPVKPVKREVKSSEKIAIHKKPKAPTLNIPIPLIILIGALVYGLVSKKETKVLTEDLKDTFDQVIDNPNNVELLRSIGPYLGTKEQNLVYTVVGILDAASIIRDVVNQTYQQKIQAMSRNVPKDPLTKRVEMLKVLKPYIPESNKHVVDRVVKIYDTIDKVNHNLEIYRNNQMLLGDRNTSPIDSINEIAKVVSPLLPDELRDKADKVIRVMKMAETLSQTESVMKKKPDKKLQNKDFDTHDGDDRTDTFDISDKDNNKDDKDYSGNKEKTDQMINTLKSMVPDEQKDSIDVLMKMAQLLAQPSDE